VNGFLTQSLNLGFKQGLYEIIIESLIKCSDLMRKDCSVNRTVIANHEEKIRNHLLENYLENSDLRTSIGLAGIAIRFIPETPENYDSSTDTYVGRADIKVVSSNWLLSNNNDYYIIECKRIDGSKPLNEKYIDDGICRFVVYPPKYPSYHNKNIMFGFVVKNIDVVSNVSKISKLHESKLKKLIDNNFNLIRNSEDKQFFLYESKYIINSKSLELRHIFYNFSTIIKTN